MLNRFIITLFVLTPIYHLVNTESIAQEATVVIDQYEEDITGDGRKESISLKGSYLSTRSDFYQNVWLEIIDQDNNQWRIHYGSAYEPTLTLIDLNHDHIPYLLFQKSVDDYGQTASSLHSLKNADMQKVAIPKHEYIFGSFQDDFIVKLKMFPHKQSIVIEVNQYATKYIEENIYTEEGKLINKRAITIPHSPHYEPLFISNTKGFGLKSEQSIYGIDQFDKLGTIETIWYIDEGEWRQLRTRFIPY